jgi:hypothetical protein
MKSILDPSFRYRPSHDTDVRRTFERIREELKRAAAERRALDPIPAVQFRKELS